MSIEHIKPGQPLSKPEVAVLELLSKDFNSVQAAEMLGLSPNTVKDYVRRIHRKLEVNTNGGAVARGLREGVIR